MAQLHRTEMTLHSCVGRGWHSYMVYGLYITAREDRAAMAQLHRMQDHMAQL